MVRRLIEETKEEKEFRELDERFMSYYQDAKVRDLLNVEGVEMLLELLNNITIDHAKDSLNDRDYLLAD